MSTSPPSAAAPRPPLLHRLFHDDVEVIINNQPAPKGLSDPYDDENEEEEEEEEYEEEERNAQSDADHEHDESNSLLAAAAATASATTTEADIQRRERADAAMKRNFDASAGVSITLYDRHKESADRHRLCCEHIRSFASFNVEGCAMDGCSLADVADPNNLALHQYFRAATAAAFDTLGRHLAIAGRGWIAVYRCDDSVCLGHSLLLWKGNNNNGAETIPNDDDDNNNNNDHEEDEKSSAAAASVAPQARSSTRCSHRQRVLNGVGSHCFSLSFSLDSCYLAASSISTNNRDPGVTLWSALSGLKLRKISLPGSLRRVIAWTSSFLVVSSETPKAHSARPVTTTTVLNITRPGVTTRSTNDTTTLYAVGSLLFPLVATMRLHNSGVTHLRVSPTDSELVLSVAHGPEESGKESSNLRRSYVSLTRMSTVSEQQQGQHSKSAEAVAATSKAGGKCKGHASRNRTSYACDDEDEQAHNDDDKDDNDVGVPENDLSESVSVKSIRSLTHAIPKARVLDANFDPSGNKIVVCSADLSTSVISLLGEVLFRTTTRHRAVSCCFVLGGEYVCLLQARGDEYTNYRHDGTRLLKFVQPETTRASQQAHARLTENQLREHERRFTSELVGSYSAMALRPGTSDTVMLLSDVAALHHVTFAERISSTLVNTDSARALEARWQRESTAAESAGRKKTLEIVLEKSGRTVNGSHVMKPIDFPQRKPPPSMCSDAFSFSLDDLLKKK